jgi:hypothetical protein
MKFQIWKRIEKEGATRLLEDMEAVFYIRY